MPSLSETYKKLIATLEEIFQLDQADLDFGIYRIMNQKRNEINDFLEKRLLKQVEETLASTGAMDGAAIAKELDETIKQAKSMGVTDPEELPKVKELRVQYAAAGSPEAMTNEVFSHLTSFFRRYYNQGDFISQRRYKKDVYAIPYEGEEVKLYWANHDQYYIKTSEYFKSYRFNIDGNKTVNFRLREAGTEQNNNKAQQGKERRFKLADEDIIEVTDNTLTIWFTYEPHDKKQKQDKLNEQTFETLKPLIPEDFYTGLLKPMPTAKNPTRTLFEKQLKDYTARNTFDYFIHKDLGGFLNRELDFYIKNEILNIDDINLDSPQSFDRQLRMLKALKTVARKIIALLAQLEDFQKKLWLKKKMVVQCDYCITLDRIPEDFYPDIVANQAQHDEWVKLFAIDETEGDTVTAPYSNPLTVEFLKTNPFLVLDTKFFGREWKYKLLATIDNIDEQCDGLLINSENFQALNILTERYNRSIDGIYIDPPYNAKSSEILYKNDFKHSSWLSLMHNRLACGKKLIKINGVQVIAIDEVEQEVLGQMLNEVFDDYQKAAIPIMHNPRGQQGKNISYVHEFAYFLYPNDKEKYISNLPRAVIDSRNLRDSGTESDRTDARNCFYPFIVRDNSIIEIGNVPNDDYHPTGNNVIKSDGTIEIWPIDDSGNEKKWRYAKDSVSLIIDKLELTMGRNALQVIFHKDTGIMRSMWHGPDFDASEYGTKTLQSIMGVEDAKQFSYPKSIKTLNLTLKAMLNNKLRCTLIDYFAGSGTTGHAVINLNREDGGTRKYILVEMGEYFNTVTKPRIQRVIYSEDWRNGKPLSRKGSSHCFKYMRLESYEDTLNNLQLKRTDQQQALLSHEHFGEEYLLHYMLDIESRNSLLNPEMFKKPFGYTLKITENNELAEQEVDLVETFNYLIGLVVESMQIIRDHVVVYGRNLQGEKILVLWRDVDKTDNAALNEFFRKLDINTRDTEFKRIYVNGDNNLENIRLEDEQWKVVLIEEEFHKRMFDTKDV